MSKCHVNNERLAAQPSPVCTGLFLAFIRRDDLLPEAMQIFPDKNIGFLCQLIQIHGVHPLRDRSIARVSFTGAP
jgi:hypothetical protein